MIEVLWRKMTQLLSNKTTPHFRKLYANVYVLMPHVLRVTERIEFD